MRNRQRRVFAAPFILTMVAAIPGCGGPKPVVEEPKPDPDATTYQTWTVRNSGDQCDAYVEVDCPPPDQATCNPPPPMAVACPAGLAEGDQVTVVQYEENGPCFIGEATTDCPRWETETTE